MRYYPVFLDIKGRPCTVIGGGEVAERKVEVLLSAGASVRVISPRLTERIKALFDEGRLEVTKRRYRKGDLEGSFLVVSASDSKEVNRAVFDEAARSNMLVNVVDDPEHCNFIVPSIIDRGSLQMAISTSGKAPYLAKRLREELEGRIGKEYGAFIEILGAVRKKLLKSGVKHGKKERVIKALVNSQALEWVKEKRLEDIDGLLKTLIGEGYTLSKLGVKIKNTGGSRKALHGAGVKKHG